MSIIRSISLGILLSFFALTVFAQRSSSIAYVNSDEILEFLPGKEKARSEVLELNNKYKEELLRMQNDYNKKYSDFMALQSSVPENIRLRRMQELYELEKNINEFVKVSQEDVLKREKMLLEPLRAKIKSAISDIGIDGRFECIYDISNPSILFVTPDAVDITEAVKKRLR